MVRRQAIALALVMGMGATTGCAARAPDPRSPRTYVIDDTSNPDARAVSEQEVLPGVAQLEAAGEVQRLASLVTRRVSQLKARTREEGAVVPFVCIDETLREVDQVRRMIGQRLHALALAVEEDDEARHHQHRILIVLGDRVRRLEQRALTCYVTPEVPGADDLRASGGPSPAGG